MVQTICKQPEAHFTWVDITDPEPGELEAVALEYGLHPNAVEDCLEPMHLPKIEFHKNVIFVILRSFDDRFNGLVERVQQMTRKVAIFCSDDFIITIRRKHTDTFAQFQEKYSEFQKENESFTLMVLIKLIDTVARSYIQQIEEAERTMDGYESFIFQNKTATLPFEEFYKFKRKVALIKKMLRQTIEINTKLDFIFPNEHKSQLQDVKETLDQLFFQADEMLHDGNNLVNMHISMGGHYTNEIVRVLTIVSAIFSPLTFIVGVYGMNFDYMPELRYTWGYPITWLVMLLIVIGTLIVFRRKRWI